jgi:hypothetical protein
MKTTTTTMMMMRMMIMIGQVLVRLFVWIDPAIHHIVQQSPPHPHPPTWRLEMKQNTPPPLPVSSPLLFLLFLPLSCLLRVRVGAWERASGGRGQAGRHKAAAVASSNVRAF